MELFRNNGNANNHPTIKVASYASNLLEHTLDVVEDALETGATYKFVFRVTNSVGVSVDSDIAEYQLVGVPEAPSAPTIM
jgi:hypothetical protein